MARTDPQVNFRIPAELKAKLEQAAHENGRSITNELVARLEASFDNDQPSKEGLEQRLKDLEQALIVSTTHYEQLIKLFEQKIDIRSLLATPKEKAP